MKKLLALSLVLLTALTLVVPMSAKDNETVEALYFDAPPVFDGVITEEEWGKPTVEVKAGQATTYQMGADVVELTMKLWLRWDEEYMYVGVTSPDTDGQSLQDAGANKCVVRLSDQRGEGKCRGPQIAHHRSERQREV